jgi:hypothetical protein
MLTRKHKIKKHILSLTFKPELCFQPSLPAVHPSNHWNGWKSQRKLMFQAFFECCFLTIFLHGCLLSKDSSSPYLHTNPKHLRGCTTYQRGGCNILGGCAVPVWRVTLGRLHRTSLESNTWEVALYHLEEYNWKVALNQLGGKFVCTIELCINSESLLSYTLFRLNLTELRGVLAPWSRLQSALVQ